MEAQTNFPSVFPLFSSRLAGPNTAYFITMSPVLRRKNHLGRPRRPLIAAHLFKITSREYEGLEHEPDFLAALEGQRSKLGHCLLPFIATPGDEHTPFRDCMFFRKGMYRSAIAAVTPDWSSNWMAAEELERLQGGSMDCQTLWRWLTAR